MNASNLIRRDANFRRVWIGQLLSQSGTRMYQIAILWWILSQIKQNSSLALGAFLVMGALPSILLVRPIGKLIDRHSSRKLLVFSDILAAAAVSAVAALLYKGQLTLPVLYGVSLLVALAQSVIDPTLNKAVSEVAQASDIESGVALVSSTQSLANFGGAAIGALLIDTLGILGVISLNALSYVVCAFCNAGASFPYARLKTDEPPSSSSKSGWSLLDKQPVLRNILLCFGCVNFFATPTLVVLPLYVKNALGGDAATLGLLESALWAGLLSGTLASAKITFYRSTLKFGAACLFLFAWSLSMPGFIIHSGAYMLFLFIAGFALGLNNVKFITLFHAIVEQRIKGRFFALMQALIGFTFPVAFLVFGILGDLFDAPSLCLIQGLGIGIIAIVFYRLADREGEISPQAAAENREPREALAT